MFKYYVKCHKTSYYNVFKQSVNIMRQITSNVNFKIIKRC